MKKMFEKIWFIPAIFTAGLIVLFLYPNVWATIGWSAGCTLLGLWWFFSLMEVSTGTYVNIVNLGNAYVATALGQTPGLTCNDPESVNFDPRYPKFYFIPLKEELRLVNGKNTQVFTWGAPGYEEQEDVKVDHTYADDRQWLEREQGYRYVGFWPFYRAGQQRILARKMVAADTVMKKITGKDGDTDELPEWKLLWNDKDQMQAIIQREKVVTQRRVYTKEHVIIWGAETGFKPKGSTDAHALPADAHHDEHHAAEGHATTKPLSGELHDDEHMAKEDRDEMVQIDVPVEMQVHVTNPFALATKTGDMQSALDSTVSEAMRDFIADNTIDSIQSGDHSKPNSTFKLMFLGLNGKWQRIGENYTLSQGLDRGFGMRFTDRCFFQKWDPANEQSEKMINAHQQVYISIQEKITAINKGIAAGSEYEEKVNRMTNADVRRRKELSLAGADPNVKAVAKAIGKHRGTLVMGEGGLTKILNVNDDTSSVKPSKEEKEKENEEKPHKEEKKSAHETKKGGSHGGHDNHDHPAH